MATDSCKKEGAGSLPRMRTEAGHRLFPYPHLTQEDKDYMVVYKCRGEDHGLLNNYVLNHVYDFVVEKVLPRWLAPNVLTLAGPVPAIIFACLCHMLPHEMTDPAVGSTSWIVLNICAGLSVFWFLLMDNVDGKHARHIKWCSPLGDWLDHALDIVSYLSIISSLCILSGLGTTAAWFFSGITVLTYAIVIWEAQLCGELIIHPIEACSEGMFLIGCMHFVFTIIGDPTSVLQKVVFVMPKAEFLEPIAMSGLPITVKFIFITVEMIVCAMSLFSVVGVVARLCKQEPVLRVLSAVLGLVVPLIACFTSSVMFYFKYTEICEEHHAANVLQLVAPAIYSIYICNLCRLMGWRFTIVETFTRPMPVVFALLPWVLLLVLPPGTVLVVSAACSAGSLVLWFFSVSIALKNMLGIPLLRVGNKQEKQN